MHHPLTDQEFVRESLEIHLLYARNLKEEAMCLMTAFTEADCDCAEEACCYYSAFTDILCEAVCLADGYLEKDVLESCELFTPYTEKAECKTMDYTGIYIPIELTECEEHLTAGHAKPCPEDMCTLECLNDMAICIVDDFIKFNKIIKSKVCSGEMFIDDYVSDLEHYIEISKCYCYSLKRTQCRKRVKASEFNEHIDYACCMMKHYAEMSAHLLDPQEEGCIAMYNHFAHKFEKSIKKAQKHHTYDFKYLKKCVSKFAEFQEEETKKILCNDIQSVILPIYADHILRQIYHFLRMLEECY